MNHEVLIRYLDAYKRYIDAQKRGENVRPLANTQEDYKRGVARKAAEVLEIETWAEDDIGKGTIGARAIKAVQRNQNLIGRFQVSVFADKPGKIFQIQGFFPVFLSIFTGLARNLYIILYITVVARITGAPADPEPDEKNRSCPVFYTGKKYCHFFLPGTRFGTVFAIYAYDRHEGPGPVIRAPLDRILCWTAKDTHYVLD